MSKKKRIVHSVLIGLTIGLLFTTVSNLFKSDIEQVDRTHTKVMKELKREVEKNNNKHIIIKP